MGVLWTGSLKNQNIEAWGGGGLSKMEGRRETVHLAREKRLSEDRVLHPILAKPRGAGV